MKLQAVHGLSKTSEAGVTGKKRPCRVTMSSIETWP